jgi:hypothetical protein
MAKRRRHHHKHRSLSGCAGIKGKGRLKKGYKFRRGGGCPVKV